MSSRKGKKAGGRQRFRDGPPLSLFPTREELLNLLTVVAVAVSVAVACHYLASSSSSSWYLLRRSRPFCDSAGAGVEDDDLLSSVLVSEVCDPCPEHGVCSGGQLECAHGYKKLGRICVQDVELERTAKKLLNQIKHRACEANAWLLCGRSVTVWFTEADIMNIVEEHKKENEGLKGGSSMMIKQMVMESAGGFMEARTNLEGIKEFKCPDKLAELHKPVSCSVQQWMYKHALLLLCILAVMALGIRHFRKVLQRKHLLSRAEQVYEQICEILEDHSILVKNSNSKDEPSVVYSWLRNHLLLTKERKDATLWKKVEELVQGDTRIDQYPKLIKGESKIVLEWQVEGHLSSKMKLKGIASKTKEKNQVDHSSTTKLTPSLRNTILGSLHSEKDFSHGSVQSET